MFKRLLFAATLVSAFQASADSEGYKKSECYQEYYRIYSKSVQSAVNDFRFRANLALSTGVVLNSRAPSDYGKSEKSILNAADLTPTYNENRIEGPWLNDFSYIHHRVLKKYPSTDPNETREWIREGFKSGEFCSKFLFIKNRKDKKGVAKYVISKIEEKLESGAIAHEHINDSELAKDVQEQGEGQSTNGGQGSAGARQN